MAIASAVILPTWRSLDDAAEQTGISRRTLTRWVSEGKLRAYSRAGDRKRYIDLDEMRKLQQLEPVKTRDELKVRLTILVENLEASRTYDRTADTEELRGVVHQLRAYGIDTYDRGTAMQIKRAEQLLSAGKTR
jgi:excisionase family DNA binding protein